MASRESKTQPTKVAPETFLETVTPPQRKADGLTLLRWFPEVTGLQPKMWGPSMIGYGRYAYTYDSGRSGEMFLTGFSPRKTSLVLYIMPGYADLAEPLSRLGKHKLGKSCLYVNKLADVDMEVLADIVRLGLAEMREKYPTWDE